jgi:hypothetical protein
MDASKSRPLSHLVQALAIDADNAPDTADEAARALREEWTWDKLDSTARYHQNRALYRAAKQARSQRPSPPEGNARKASNAALRGALQRLLPVPADELERHARAKRILQRHEEDAAAARAEGDLRPDRMRETALSTLEGLRAHNCVLHDDPSRGPALPGLADARLAAPLTAGDFSAWRVFHVNRERLARASDFFRAAFAFGAVESATHDVVLRDPLVDADTVGLALDMLYTRSAPSLTSAQAVRLLPLLSFWMPEGRPDTVWAALTRTCQHAMVANLTPDDALNVFTIATGIQHTMLASWSLRVALRAPKFREGVLKLAPSDFVEVARSEALALGGEDAVALLVEEWATARSTQEGCSIEEIVSRHDLLACLRPALFTEATLKHWTNDLKAVSAERFLEIMRERWQIDAGTLPRAAMERPPVITFDGPALLVDVAMLQWSHGFAAGSSFRNNTLTFTHAGEDGALIFRDQGYNGASDRRRWSLTTKIAGKAVETRWIARVGDMPVAASAPGPPDRCVTVALPHTPSSDPRLFRLSGSATRR